MRSKLKIITMGWYKIATFDLIRSGLSRTTFPSRGRLSSEVRGWFLRVKPSPAYRGWHGASRDGCGGDPVRYSDCPVRRYAPHPSALTGCHLLPREKAFCLAGRHLKLGRSHPLSHGQQPMTAPPAQGSQTHRRYCLPPLIRLLRGHLPPREGISQEPLRPTSNQGHSLRP